MINPSGIPHIRHCKLSKRPYASRVTSSNPNQAAEANSKHHTFFYEFYDAQKVGKRCIWCTWCANAWSRPTTSVCSVTAIEAWHRSSSRRPGRKTPGTTSPNRLRTPERSGPMEQDSGWWRDRRKTETSQLIPRRICWLYPTCGVKDEKVGNFHRNFPKLNSAVA